MKMAILMYHMVCETGDAKEKRYCCHPDAFKHQMAHLKKAGYQVVGLDDLINSIKKGTTLPEKSIAITFDDGFADNYENAFPVLQEYGFPATVFAVSRRVGRTNEWMENNGFPRRELLGWNGLKEMSANGIAVGSHTTTHASLIHIDRESAGDEIVNSKAELEAALGKPVHFFAYPYGLFNEHVKKLVVQAGYLGACCTRSGFNSEDANPFVLRRIEVYGSDPLWKFFLKLKFGTNEATLTLPLKYYWSRLLHRLTLFTPKQ